MSKLSFYKKDNFKISYRYYKRSKKTLIFLHGLLSDKSGKKSNFLNNYCKKNKISYLCFDFQGHGRSSGEFTNFGISDWYNDLVNIINYLKIKNYYTNLLAKTRIDIYYEHLLQLLYLIF